MPVNNVNQHFHGFHLSKHFLEAHGGKELAQEVCEVCHLWTSSASPLERQISHEHLTSKYIF